MTSKIKSFDYVFSSFTGDELRDTMAAASAKPFTENDELVIQGIMDNLGKFNFDKGKEQAVSTMEGK